MPTKINHVIHHLTLQGSDLDVTMFVEYLNKYWFNQWKPLLKFDGVRYDLGSDTVTFNTSCGKTSMLNFVKEFSLKFERMTFMYHYYTTDKTEQNLVYVSKGEEKI